MPLQLEFVELINNTVKQHADAKVVQSSLVIDTTLLLYYYYTTTTTIDTTTIVITCNRYYITMYILHHNVVVTSDLHVSTVFHVMIGHYSLCTSTF